MGLVELCIAIFVLLVTPGPTNTLLLIGGSERGLARALRLIPYEIAGYLSTVLPLALAGNALLDSLPGLRAGWRSWQGSGWPFWRSSCGACRNRGCIAVL